MQCPARSIDLPRTMQKTAAALSKMLPQQRAIAKNRHNLPGYVVICGAMDMGGKRAVVKT